MRTSSVLPTPFDRVSYRHSTFWLFFKSRLARYALLALIAVCLITIAPPGKESSFSDFQSTFPTDSLLQVTEWNERAALVKAAFVRVYGAYERRAYPHDELLPVTDKPRDT